MNSVGLVDNWTQTVGTRDGPTEEGNGGDRRVDSLDCEKMADFVHREPESWEGEQPKKEEAKEILSFNAGADRETIVKFPITWPDGLNHQGHTLPWVQLVFAPLLDQNETYLQYSFAPHTR